MALKRLIPVVLIKNGLLVRSQLFKYHQAIGDPIPTIKRLSDWNSDEIILLNIGSNTNIDSRRDDKYHNLGEMRFKELVNQTSKFCFCPITIGGGLKVLEDIDDMFKAGADKVTLNTMCFKNPEIVLKAVDKYGSQAITASIDIKKISNGCSAWIENGKIDTGKDINDAIKYVRSLGVGEILLSSIDKDGSGEGYDENIINSITERIDFPIILNSGATTVEHFTYGLKQKDISAVAASNVFYFTELSYPNFKNELAKQGFNNIRKMNLDQTYVPREPAIDTDKRARLLEKGAVGKLFDKQKYNGQKQTNVKYCRKCLYSSASATPMQFDETGLCMGCRVYETKKTINNDKYTYLENNLKQLTNYVLNNSKKHRKYDCIVSVSGGKDSYYQTHFVKNILGLRPLLVTYNGNNYSDIGWKNLWNMREVFDCDHLIVSPSVVTIKKLNKLAFVAMGDMNWHAHIGIFTTAPRIAIQQEIPLIFWGEHGYADLCGQFSMSDFPEMNYRERTEHAGRGFDWNFFEGLENLTSEDLEPWKYPSDQEIFNVGLRQIYLGHYIPWESNDHLKLVVEKYGFKVSNEPFERTYRVGSNLDDIHENGIHDYLKYIKFGYGRCTDHASKDIRSGDLTREEGIKRATVMDRIKPKDLRRWLEYVEMTEAEFDRIADHFRDPRVWKWTTEKGWEKEELKI
jgi:imidazoleglycerol phosphate synthase cyclase subunit